MTLSLTRLRKTWVGRRRAVLTLASALGLAVLLLGFASNLFSAAKFVEWPYACDGFGYLRQAQLFRQKGWLAGLDTRIEDERTAYLLGKMRALGPPQAWRHGVAPHCHHYKEATGRIVLQYPPGTGFVFSFFTAGTQAHWAFVLHNFLVLAILGLACVTARALTVPVLAALLGVFVFRGLYRFVIDLSITPSTVTALIAGALTVAAAGETRPGRRLALMGLLGLDIGVATAFRVPNLFWAVGPAAVLGLLFLRRPSFGTFADPAALGLGTLVGLVPVLAANAVNAGHPLATTYSPVDARPPQLDWDVLADGLHFYFVEHGSPAAFVVIAAAVVAGVLIVQRRLRGPGLGAAAAMGAVSLAFTVGYMVLHWPRVAYYLFPAAAYAMAVGMFCLMRAENARADAAGLAPAAPALRLGLLAATLAAAAAVTGAVRWQVSPDYTKPNVTANFDRRAIVWADIMSGPIYYFLDRHTATLPFLPAPLRRPVMEAIARDGVPQFLVAEPGNMEAMLAEARVWAEARPAGKAFGRDVYRLEFAAARP